jgi:hypothetical protein
MRNIGIGGPVAFAGAMLVPDPNPLLAILEKETDGSPCMSKRRGCKKADAARIAHRRRRRPPPTRGVDDPEDVRVDWGCQPEVAGASSR